MTQRCSCAQSPDADLALRRPHGSPRPVRGGPRAPLGQDEVHGGWAVERWALIPRTTVVKTNSFQPVLGHFESLGSQPLLARVRERTGDSRFEVSASATHALSSGRVNLALQEKTRGCHQPLRTGRTLGSPGGHSAHTPAQPALDQLVRHSVPLGLAEGAWFLAGPLTGTLSHACENKGEIGGISLGVE